MVKMVPLVDKFRFTNGTIGNANGTNVTNVQQQMVQTEYSVGNSTNAGKVTCFNMASLKIYEFRK